MLSTVWIHACIGLHFWLRTKRWYPVWLPWLGMLALMLPTLALAGYIGAGNHFIREAAKDAAFTSRTLADANVSAATFEAIRRTVGRNGN